jgi:tetratricopeptide (TPR) repeat protein
MNDARENGDAGVVERFARQAEGLFYKIDSRTIPLEWYKGVAIFSKQQYPESETCFEKAYDLTPYNIHVMNNLASSYEINGKRQDAIKTYQEALKISPNFEEARLNLAAVYFNNTEYGKAFNTIDSCSTQTKDPKYKIFLPPILKGKAVMVLAAIDFPVSNEVKDAFFNLQDFSQIYYESKRNNITFEQQIIRKLKNSL